MSNQTDILNAIDTRMTALLPSYGRLKYSYEVEKNSSRSDDSWGAGAGAGEWETGVNRAVTLNQEFFVVIAQRFQNRSGDDNEISALKTAYDNIETIFLDFASSKLGIPTVVLVVDSLSLDEPEKIGENTIAVRARFNIKHRKPTN